MAVSTIHSSDPNGMALDAAVSAAQTALNAVSPTGANHALYQVLAVKLAAAQRAAVGYYLDIGRINPATVLSTLS